MPQRDALGPVLFVKYINIWCVIQQLQTIADDLNIKRLLVDNGIGFNNKLQKIFIVALHHG